MKLLFSLLLTVSLLSAGTVTLAWEDTKNPDTTTYSIYRANGPCNSGVVPVKLVSGIATKTYDDLNVPQGSYCYYVTAVYNASESAPSNAANAVVPLVSPAALSVTVK